MTVPYGKLLHKTKFQLISKCVTGRSETPKMAYSGENLLKIAILICGKAICTEMQQTTLCYQRTDCKFSYF